MYLCQLMCVFLPPCLPCSPSMSHRTFINLCLLAPSLHPMLLYSLPLTLFHSHTASGITGLYFRGGRGAERMDGRMVDREGERCSFGLVYLISYVVLLPLATLHSIFSLSCRHTPTHTQMVTHSLPISVWIFFPYYQLVVEHEPRGAFIILSVYLPGKIVDFQRTALVMWPLTTMLVVDCWQNSCEVSSTNYNAASSKRKYCIGIYCALYESVAL